MTHRNEAPKHSLPPVAAGERVTLRSPAELADALPYLMGFHPNDSIVMVAVHGPRGRFGGRLRLGIPPASREWPQVCDELAECLVSGSSKRSGRPEGIVLFLCQDTTAAESPREVMERLRPLAQRLRTACGSLGVPVLEALCISNGRFWSYCCPDGRCCPAEGEPLALPGTSVMAAAAAYAGIRVRGTLREMEARLSPLSTGGAVEQQRALDTASMELIPKIMAAADCTTLRADTLSLMNRMLDRYRAAQSIADPYRADARDDALLAHQEAAAVIVGLQDRVARDRAAEWMEGPEGEAALRLWRAVARRCVGPYTEYAAAPLTLAGWVAWSLGDEPSARVALARALTLDPEYLFARLLHQACNEGVDPEPLRQCLREERAGHAPRLTTEAERERSHGPSPAPGAPRSSGAKPARADRGRSRPSSPRSHPGPGRKSCGGTGAGRRPRRRPR